VEQSLRLTPDRTPACVPAVQTSPFQESATDGREEKELRSAQVRQSCREARRERDAPAQEGDTQEWTKRPEGEEPRASHCDRIVRSARERREGAEQAVEQQALRQQALRQQAVLVAEVVIEAQLDA
jgi:hypothetical protein